MKLEDDLSSTGLAAQQSASARPGAIDRLLDLPWWVWIWAGNLFFITFTTLAPYMPGAIRYRLFHYFDLGAEMNFGAWWAGVSLLLTALLAYRLFSISTGRARPAWLVLALVLFVLSWDEIGSLHERVGGFSELLPYIVVFALLLAYSLGTLFLSATDRRPILLIGVMFGLFASAILQERIEHMVNWPAWLTGIRVGIEETSELLGIAFGFWGFSLLLKQPASPENWAAGRAPRPGSLLAILPDPLTLRGLPVLLLVGFGLHALASFLMAPGFEVNQLGNPVVWYPVAVYVLLFALAMWRVFRSGPGISRLWLITALFFLLTSAASMYLISPRQEISRFQGLGLISNFYFLFGIHLALVAIFYWRLTGPAAKAGLPILGFGVILLAAGFVFQGLAFQFLVSGALALLVANLFLWRKFSPAMWGETEAQMEAR